MTPFGARAVLELNRMIYWWIADWLDECRHYRLLWWVRFDQVIQTCELEWVPSPIAIAIAALSLSSLCLSCSQSSRFSSRNSVAEARFFKNLIKNSKISFLQISKNMSSSEKAEKIYPPACLPACLPTYLPSNCVLRYFIRFKRRSNPTGFERRNDCLHLIIFTLASDHGSDWRMKERQAGRRRARLQYLMSWLAYTRHLVR